MDVPERFEGQIFGDSDAAHGGFSIQGNKNKVGDVSINHHHHHPPASPLWEGLAGAAFNAASKQYSPSCLEYTRRNILEQIEKWADGDGSKRIYWLKGMAGTGKSTIALTIARKYHHEGRLGASFFFSRGGGNLASADKFGITIAAQLAATLPELGVHINDAITADRLIPELGLYQQWDKLVIKPLAQLVRKIKVSAPIVVVVDALDECDNEDDIATLIECLDAATAVEDSPLRVFVTSRPESPISIGFSGIARNAHRDFVLHNIEDSIVDTDIALFYKSELFNLATSFSIDHRLLSDDNIQTLVRKSNHLFIHAATVCRYIKDGRMLANKRLAVLLAAGNAPLQPERQLDKLYSIVLENQYPKQVNENEEAEYRDLFKYIIGSIVVLFDEMTLAGLAIILGKQKDEITRMLRFFHSVLHIPEEETRPIRLLHPSFRDFLLNPERCENRSFSLVATEIHRHLFDNCLRLMEQHLRYNICNLAPGTHADDVPKAHVSKFIYLPLQYACRHWVHHLEQSDIDINEHPGIVDFFNTRFLHWLETLSLLNRVSEGIAMIRRLNIMLTPQAMEKKTWVSRTRAKLRNTKVHTPSLSQTVHDANRFLRSHSPIIAKAPLQTYSSTILFSPKESLIRNFYIDRVPGWIIRPPITTDHWDPCLQKLANYPNVSAVTFLPDGRTLTSGSRFQIKLWDVAIDKMQRALGGHTRPSYISSDVHAMTFSTDGRTMVSGFKDVTVHLCGVTTGKTQHEVQGHRSTVHTIAFSPDGRTVASGSRDETVRLWDVTTGQMQRAFEGHADSVYAVAFSPDGRTVASGSIDKTVRLWDITTGKMRRTLQGHANSVHTVAISPNGRTIASGSIDRTVRLWDMTTGICFQSVDADVAPFELSFDQDGHSLVTERGTVLFNGLCRASTIANPKTMELAVTRQNPASTDRDQNNRPECGVSRDLSWITFNGKNVLYLPDDCRPGVSASFGSNIAIGTRSGRIIIMRFAPEGPVELRSAFQF